MISCPRYDFTNTAPVVGITGYNTLAPNDQEAVMTHLAEVTPRHTMPRPGGPPGGGGLRLRLGRIRRRRLLGSGGTLLMSLDCCF